MTDVNKYIKRTRHTIPTLRELETSLNGAKFFWHLDMNDGYMQLESAEESRKLTTFYTQRGLKRFKRLQSDPRFNLRSVTFFGKVFPSEGISPDPNKVAALHAAGPPQSQAEVRSFLFFAGANADFMEGFAQITAPLRDLIKQGAPLQWAPECQRAFEQPKRFCQGTW